VIDRDWILAVWELRMKIASRVVLHVSQQETITDNYPIHIQEKARHLCLIQPFSLTKGLDLCKYRMFTKSNENACLPVVSGAGYDLFSNGEYVIQPGGRQVVSTGVMVNFPEGTLGHITSLPGLAVKHGVTILVDTVHGTEEIRVIMHNTDRTRPFAIRSGYRIAQLIFQNFQSV